VGVSGTTALQWVTGGAYLALFVACVWAGRRAALRAAAVALGMWGVNGFMFYVVLLGVYGGTTAAPEMVAWSALTRLQGILLGVVALIVLGRRRSSGE
jgi:hypothetical protein